MVDDDAEFARLLAGIKAGASIPKYEIDLKNGRFSASDAEDHSRMLETLKLLKEQNQLSSSNTTAHQQTPIAATSEPMTNASLAEVIQRYLNEIQNKNKPRTIYTKERHLADFTLHGPQATSDFATLGKTELVRFKEALVQLGNKPKTLDNKLMTVFDLFKYAIGHGFYPTKENPVSGLFLLNGAKRQAQSEHFQTFTADDLAKFFEPAAYIQMMDKPDLFWGPIIALFTGMRISEVTALRLEDIQTKSGAINFCITDSKTTAGIREVPVADALIELGLLNYVNEVRLAGFDRLFPHLRLINNSYQKKLSEGMRKRLNAIGFTISDRKSFHSFRSNVITQLTDNGCNDGQVYQLTGHELLGSAGKVHRGYMGLLPSLKQVIDTLNWPSIDLPALKYDGRFKEFLGNLNNNQRPS